MMLRRLGLAALLLLLAGTGRAQVVCPLDSRNPLTGDLPPGSCFAVYSLSGQLLDVNGQNGVTVLCAGSRIRVRYCGQEPGQQRINIRYGLNCDAVNTDTITTLTVPTTPGRFTILQQRPNPQPQGGGGYPVGLGLQYSREFVVRTPPAPAVQVRYCGSPASAVLVAVTNAQPNVAYRLQFDSGPAQPLSQPAGQQVALPPGAARLSVLADYTDVSPNLVCGGSTTLQLPAPPVAQAPVLQRLVVQPTGLDFAFAPLANDPSLRTVLLRDAAPTDLPAGSTAYTLAGGPLGSCYRLSLIDACGTTLFSSAVLCPVDLQVTSANRRNSLSWAHAAGSTVSAYEVRRGTEVLATLPAATRTYIDSAVTCGVSYRYQVVARSGAATSESLVREVQTVGNQAAAAPRLSASFRFDNQVEINLLSALSDTASRLQLRRTLGSSSAELPPSRRRPVLDAPGTVSLALVPCYAGRLADPCGNVSAESGAVCPPVLQATPRPTDRNANLIDLLWTEPAGQGSGWRYRLQLLDAAGQELAGTALSATGGPVQAPAPPAERQVLRYRLQATSAAGLVVYSNVATVVRRLMVAIPTAFSPNGDGLNDQLEIKGRFLTTFNFRLFDRNGREVFRATDATQRWDGRIRGEQAAPQVFAFLFEATDETGQRIVQRGTVTLLR